MAHGTMRIRTAAALIATAIVVAACGGDTADTQAEPATTAPALTTTQPPVGDDGAAAAPETAMADGDTPMDDHEHADDHMDATVEAGDDMTLELAVGEDGGVWSIEVITSGFRFAPESKDGPHVQGEGHAHLYVDGEKVATLLEPTYVLGELSPGDHTLAVDLRSNDHALYELAGQALRQSQTVTVAGDSGGSDADLRVVVEFGDGSAFEDLGRIETGVGEVVEIVIRADVAEDVHVHGFDVFGMVTPGEDAIVRFEPDAPGIYEVEMEGSGRLLFELQVNG